MEKSCKAYARVSLAEERSEGVKEEERCTVPGKVVQPRQRKDHLWDDYEIRWCLSQVSEVHLSHMEKGGRRHDAETALGSCRVRSDPLLGRAILYPALGGTRRAQRGDLGGDAGARRYRPCRATGQRGGLKALIFSRPIDKHPA